MNQISMELKRQARHPVRRFWHGYVSRLKKHPEDMVLVLKSWEPEDTGVTNLLPTLMADISLPWWQKQEPWVREGILSEMIRLDGGKGIIVPWLVSVIKTEPEPRVLGKAASWQPLGKAYPSELLEVWIDRSWSGIGAIRQSSWQVFLGVPELENQVAELLLQRLPMESDCHVLTIMSQWKPSETSARRGIPQKILDTWGKKLRQVTRGEGENDHETGQGYRKVVWQGWLNAALNCPGEKEMIINEMTGFLSDENDIDVLKKIAEWTLATGFALQTMQEGYSKVLESSPAEVRKTGWKLLEKPAEGTTTSGQLNLKVWNRCKEALQNETFSRVLDEIVPPAGLADWQWQEWWAIWIEKLQNQNEETGLSAGKHLLRFANSRLLENSTLRELFLKRMEKMVFPENVRILMDGIQKWQFGGQKPWDFFKDGFVRLNQCSRSGIRLAVVQSLAQKLENADPDGEDAAILAPLWLMALKKETDPEILGFMAQWHFKGGKLPKDMYCESMVIWKQMAESGAENMRRAGWEALCRAGDEEGKFLVKCLARENSGWVMNFMSRWRPTPGTSLPDGFWNEWEECIERYLKKQCAHHVELSLVTENLAELCLLRIGQDPGESDRMRLFWDRLKSKGVPERKCDLFQCVGTLDEPPEMFRQKMEALHERSESWYKIFLSRIGQMEQGSTDLNHNVRQNRITAATIALNCRDENIRRMGCQMLEAMWKNHGKSTDNPVGEGEMLQEMLTKAGNWPDKRMSEILKLCHRLSDSGQKMYFWAILEKARCNPDAGRPHLLELVLWREVGVAWETGFDAIHPGTSENNGAVDKIPMQRFLRQLVYCFSTKNNDGQRMPPGSSARREGLANILLKHLGFRMNRNGGVFTVLPVAIEGRLPCFREFHDFRQLHGETIARAERINLKKNNLSRV